MKNYSLYLHPLFHVKEISNIEIGLAVVIDVDCVEEGITWRSKLSILLAHICTFKSILDIKVNRLSSFKWLLGKIHEKNAIIWLVPRTYWLVLNADSFSNQFMLSLSGMVWRNGKYPSASSWYKLLFSNGFQPHSLKFNTP